MKRKIFSILTVLLLLFAFSVQVVAQDDDDDDEPRRRRGRGYGFLANRTLSVGLIGAMHLSTTYSTNGITTPTTDSNDQQKFFGLQGRLFLSPSFGASIDIIMLDQQVESDFFATYEATLFLLNFGLVYRLKIARSIVANGGAGISQTMLQIETTDIFGTTSKTEYGPMGYYLRIGGEIFFGAGRRISVTADWTWMTWGELDLSSGDDISRRVFSFQAGIHYWL